MTTFEVSFHYPVQQVRWLLHMDKDEKLRPSGSVQATVISCFASMTSCFVESSCSPRARPLLDFDF